MKVGVLVAGHMRSACNDDGRLLVEQLRHCRQADLGCSAVLSTWSEITGSTATDHKCGSYGQLIFSAGKCKAAMRLNASRCIRHVAREMRARDVIVRDPYPPRTMAKYPRTNNLFGAYQQMVEGIIVAAREDHGSDVLLRIRPDINGRGRGHGGLTLDEYRAVSRLPDGVVRAYDTLRAKWPPRPKFNGVKIRCDNVFVARRATFLSFVSAWNETLHRCVDAPLHRSCRIPRNLHGHIEWSMALVARRLGMRLEDPRGRLLLPWYTAR